MRKRLSMAAFVVVLSALGAQAQEELGYSDVTLGYTEFSSNIDLELGPLTLPLSLDGDGPNLGVSAAVTDDIHVFADYLDLSATGQVLGLEIGGDATLWEVGVGWHGLLGDRADLVVEASYFEVEIEVESVGFSRSDGGPGLTGGVRVLAAPKLELAAFAGWIGGVDATDTTIGAVGGKIFFDITDVFTVGAIYIYNSEGHSLNLGVRLDWGKRK